MFTCKLKNILYIKKREKYGNQSKSSWKYFFSSLVFWGWLAYEFELLTFRVQYVGAIFRITKWRK